jgi:transposase-like protein
VLDILVQPLRNRQAAKKFFRKLLHRLQYIPRAIITDKLGSYAAAKAEVLPDVEHYTISEQTIARRIPTSQRENENVACGVSRRPDTPSGFSRPMG